MTARRVLLVIKGLGAGGAEQLLVNSIPYLDRSSFEYEIAYFLREKTDHAGAFREAGIPVTCLGSGSQFDPRVVGRVADFVRARAFDVLDVHLPYPGVVSRLARRRAPGPVLLYTEHSLSVQRRLSRGRIISFALNVATYGWNDHLVAVSHDTERDVRRFARHRVPVSLVHNGIPFETFDRARSTRQALPVPDDAIVVGHVAKMVSKKRQLDLLEAARVVIAERPDTHFVLTGKGPMRPRLEARAVQLGIADNVHFVGFVDDIAATMAAFDVFALTSMHEGLPTVCMEALAVGVPVVATAVGGTPEIVDDGITGLLVPPRRPLEMAAALLSLVNDAARRREMGGRGAAIVRERFSLSRRVRAVESLYESLLAERLAAR